MSGRSVQPAKFRIASEVERRAQLGQLFSPLLAAAIAACGGDEALKTHRREICVVFVDLRGFTAFTELAEPEEVMELLRAYHALMGRMVVAHAGTLERFAGDALMIVFNDPVPIDRPAERAVKMALAMQDAFPPLAAAWKRRGYELGLACGVAQGYATLGPVGFEGRWDYAAIGSVTNLAARLCAEASDSQVLVESKAMARIEDVVDASPIGPLTLKGFSRPVPAFAVERMRCAGLGSGDPWRREGLRQRAIRVGCDGVPKVIAFSGPPGPDTDGAADGGPDGLSGTVVDCRVVRPVIR